MLSKAPRKSSGSWVGSPRLQQSPPQFEAVSSGLRLGWRMGGCGVVLGGWQRRKMQSNQVSDGVIIKITTTPISVEFSAFYLHYLICPHASRGRRVHCPKRRDGLTPVPRVLGPGPRSQAHRASCWGGGTGRGVRGSLRFLDGGAVAKMGRASPPPWLVSPTPPNLLCEATALPWARAPLVHLSPPQLYPRLGLY